MVANHKRNERLTTAKLSLTYYHCFSSGKQFSSTGHFSMNQSIIIPLQVAYIAKWSMDWVIKGKMYRNLQTFIISIFLLR